MKNFLVVCLLLLSTPALLAQEEEEVKKKKFKLESENSLQLGASFYMLADPFYKRAKIHPLSNKGIIVAFENRTSIRRWVYLASTAEGEYWNSSILGPYYDGVLGIVNDTNKFLHSINNFSGNLKLAFSFPVQIRQINTWFSIGVKWRLLHNSEGRVFDLAEQELSTNSGYHILPRIRQNDFDHLAILFQHKKLNHLEIKLESDHLISSYIQKIGNWFNHGYYYRETDGRYEFFNLNVKLCYKI